MLSHLQTECTHVLMDGKPLCYYSMCAIIGVNPIGGFLFVVVLVVVSMIIYDTCCADGNDCNPGSGEVPVVTRPRCIELMCTSLLCIEVQKKPTSLTL